VSEAVLSVVALSVVVLSAVEAVWVLSVVDVSELVVLELELPHAASDIAIAAQRQTDNSFFFIKISSL
jgi:hypothetical protein